VGHAAGVDAEDRHQLGLLEPLLTGRQLGRRRGLPHPAEDLQDGRGLQVADRGRLAAVEDRLAAAPGLLRVLLGVPFVQEVTAVVFEVFGQRPGAVLGKPILDADGGQLRVPGELGQHAPGDLLRGGQLDLVLLAGRVGVVAPPGLAAGLVAHGPGGVLGNALAVGGAVGPVLEAVGRDLGSVEGGHEAGSF
jgi:hypothetical protein